MEKATVDRIEHQIRSAFPEGAIVRIQVLQYGDDPEIEPGELLARVYLEASGGKEERRRVLETFHDTYRDAIHELRRDLDKIREAGPLEFFVTGEGEGEE